ncbi:hypothetical protein GCE86_19700 [Micromonospora terminaliae]|uniref:Uncharacterized protein n=1 Tax=Micromonospora terminaliae TaxID=1914461 RepID=A0AAJ2ZH87_9ACTN|nr:hypothetical protein [Micromonospora terminaliae]NES28943.1 hypothetical protein [Micromonospora terminaliae]QGL49038.1 hypothetical protein GCE86_19700 [Micromonospora terminaliae]
MANDCTYCPTLEARLAGVAGGLRALADLIDNELTEATMSRRELLDVAAVRVTNLAEQASGRY